MKPVHSETKRSPDSQFIGFHERNRFLVADAPWNDNGMVIGCRRGPRNDNGEGLSARGYIRYCESRANRRNSLRRILKPLEIFRAAVFD